MTLPNHFELLATDGTARTGRLTTPHGLVRTPVFMPVGTAGAMKGMHWREVRDAGADIVLGNTYHLMRRPGAGPTDHVWTTAELLGYCLPVAVMDSWATREHLLPALDTLHQGN